MKITVKFLCTLMVVALFSACGTAGGPFEMASQSTLVVGDAESSVQFIANPEEETPSGLAQAQVLQEFFNRRTLSVENFQMTANFGSIGEVNFHLNPNFQSTATVFKLNSNNQPFGTHTMNLFLIIETQDQNLTLDNVLLSSTTATLALTDPLPTLSFLFNGLNKQMQILSLNVVIPAELITSDQDPN